MHITSDWQKENTMIKLFSSVISWNSIFQWWIYPGLKELKNTHDFSRQVQVFLYLFLFFVFILFFVLFFCFVLFCFWFFLCFCFCCFVFYFCFVFSFCLCLVLFCLFCLFACLLACLLVFSFITLFCTWMGFFAAMLTQALSTRNVLDPFYSQIPSYQKKGKTYFILSSYLPHRVVHKSLFIFFITPSYLRSNIYFVNNVLYIKW